MQIITWKVWLFLKVREWGFLDAGSLVRVQLCVFLCSSVICVG